MGKSRRRKTGARHMVERGRRDHAVSRGRFMGYLIAAPTVLAAAELGTGTAYGAIPTKQAVDLLDLSDVLNDAALPTSALIAVAVNPDGTVSFALPRAEVGQGITTAGAMTIAGGVDPPAAQGQWTLSD